jgi:hypothetical protein
MYKALIIEYGDDHFPVEYQIRNTSVAQRWAERVVLAQQQYPIDNPDRFYGFGSVEDQVASALRQINDCIDTIKLHRADITGDRVTDIYNQDLLNYWHHIFEVHHGFLDQQHKDNIIESTLADLNICVHRCESIARGAQPRHVVTYYGLPKTSQLEDRDYDLFEDTWFPGTVFINYVEIGKTLEDLAIDNDRHIGDDAYRPFRHYSADFVVRFYEQTPAQAEQKRAIINKYFDEHRDKFEPYQKYNQPGNIPVADIIGPVSLSDLAVRQLVKSVKLL